MSFPDLSVWLALVHADHVHRAPALRWWQRAEGAIRLHPPHRVALYGEPRGVETRFRESAAGRVASPKLWADAWLLAFAQAAGGTLVTLDRALARRGGHCLLEDA